MYHSIRQCTAMILLYSKAQTWINSKIIHVPLSLCFHGVSKFEVKSSSYFEFLSYKTRYVVDHELVGMRRLCTNAHQLMQSKTIPNYKRVICFQNSRSRYGSEVHHSNVVNVCYNLMVKSNVLNYEVRRVLVESYS